MNPLRFGTTLITCASQNADLAERAVEKRVPLNARRFASDGDSFTRVTLQHHDPKQEAAWARAVVADLQDALADQYGRGAQTSLPADRLTASKALQAIRRNDGWVVEIQSDNPLLQNARLGGQRVAPLEA
ncbi:MAG: hypothetical protein IPK79_07570 [Vampirovibrionales bacterium]|nr:hypothetical protein [Vampirovibrionales bacterium]